MEVEEYKDELKKINADYEKAKQDLYRKFAMSQAKFKEGDIIKDDRWIMLVDKITVYKSDLPEPVYHGIQLKKDLTPRKDGERVCIYGNRNVELVKSAQS